MHYEVSGWSNDGIFIHLRTFEPGICACGILCIKRNDIHSQSLGRTLQMLLGKGSLYV